MTGAVSRVPLATVLGLVVALVWAVVFLADILLKDYSAALTAITGNSPDSITETPHF